MSIEMAIDMIDINMAEKVRSGIEVDDFVDFLSGPDNKLFSFKVLEIRPYSFIVQVPITGSYVQKLELSIAKTVAYIKEIEDMRMKEPPAATAAVEPSRRGRPPITKPQSDPAPADAQPLAPPPEIPYAQAEAPEDKNWVETAVNEAVENFAEEMRVILKGIVSAQENSAPDRMTPFTCFDCAFANVKENKCDKFNITPPMFVIADAAVQCGDFLNAALDEEIPF